jgi:exodeoxyribonuclease VII large subunit
MPNEAPITVSQLNRKAKTLLEQGIARLWVEGEISNLSRPSSGHIYLSLKDENAQVSAAWFRQRQRGPAIGFKNGDKVLAYGRVSIYEARGNYQLIIEQMEPAGEGVLKQRFDALKKKLLAEGLFAEDRKRKLPALPSRIGVITSPSGAAIRDIVSVLGRRFPAVPVIIYPAAVQGEAAPGELMAALETAIRRDECDDCPIPIVSAVGHEVDFTISDFVADVRAPTPSGAAEIVVPNQHDWLHRVSTLAMRIGRIGERKVQDRAQELDWLGKRLVAASPKATLQRQHDGLRENRSRLAAIMRTRLLEMRNNTQALGSELLQQSPALTVQRSIGQLATLRQRLGGSARDALSDVAHRIALLGRALNSVSPLATLDRGYAIVLDEDGKALTDASNANKGDEIRARLAKGELVARVTKVVKKQ